MNFKHKAEWLMLKLNDEDSEIVQALLDVANAAERLSLTGTHQYDLDEELLQALAKLQEQK
jgi:hypothetical protein